MGYNDKMELIFLVILTLYWPQTIQTASTINFCSLVRSFVIFYNFRNNFFFDKSCSSSHFVINPNQIDSSALKLFSINLRWSFARFSTKTVSLIIVANFVVFENECTLFQLDDNTRTNREREQERTFRPNNKSQFVTFKSIVFYNWKSMAIVLVR